MLHIHVYPTPILRPTMYAENRPPPIIAPPRPVALKMCPFSKNEVNPSAS